MPASLYTAELAEKILDRLPTESLVSILKTKGMPEYSTVMRWLRAHPEFAAAYRLAREDQGHYDADLIVEIREQVLKGKITADVARAATDSAKWTAARRVPKVYGERISLEHDVSESLAERMKEARERAGSP
jgi:hypothetical protein